VSQARLAPCPEGIEHNIQCTPRPRMSLTATASILLIFPPPFPAPNPPLTETATCGHALRLPRVFRRPLLGLFHGILYRPRHHKNRRVALKYNPPSPIPSSRAPLFKRAAARDPTGAQDKVHTSYQRPPTNALLQNTAPPDTARLFSRVRLSPFPSSSVNDAPFEQFHGTSLGRSRLECRGRALTRNHTSYSKRGTTTSSAK
jgi:hypothetical protein